MANYILMRGAFTYDDVVVVPKEDRHMCDMPKPKAAAKATGVEWTALKEREQEWSKAYLSAFPQRGYAPNAE